eukprot:362405-Chlamydomonas_euryale.AAC.6
MYISTRSYRARSDAPYPIAASLRYTASVIDDCSADVLHALQAPRVSEADSTTGASTNVQPDTSDRPPEQRETWSDTVQRRCPGAVLEAPVR